MNLAISSAAILVVDNMNQAANSPKATARSLSVAILPDFGISWNRDSTNLVTMNEINYFSLKLRNPPFIGCDITSWPICLRRPSHSPIP